MKVEFTAVFKSVGDLNADAAKTALLQKQYFPFVKAEGEELPVLLNSDSLTADCAKDLRDLKDKKHHFAGWTELRTRRFDGLVRRLGIPHPVPYARLVLHISDHWSDLAPLLHGPHSQIKPSFHADGRMVQMDYDTAEDSLSRETRLAHAQRFAVKADISNCFPSIYSHSIDWAIRGKQVAKSKGGNDGSWQANLDRLVRNCHDRETKGVMIGPAVSNLLAELVLQRVDQTMVSKGHKFLRYVDDYTAYCNDRSTAEAFVVDLQHALGIYRLDLNTRKTRIADLRDGLGEAWMAEVQSHAPSKWTDLSSARFLRQSEILATRYPAHSLLKFAVKTMLGKRTADGQSPSMLVVDELVRLCSFHPHLAPFLAKELAALGDSVGAVDSARLAGVITHLMHEAASRAETDVVLWHLHSLRRVLRRNLLKPDWAPLVDMNDDLVLLAIAAWCPRARTAVKNRVIAWDYDCDTDFQQHWLIRFELNRVGLLPDSALDPLEKDWIAVLKKHGVALSPLV